MSDELLALHKVALEAREAVQLCEAMGVHLGPLRAALADTAYFVSISDKSRLRERADQIERGGTG